VSRHRNPDDAKRFVNDEKRLFMRDWRGFFGLLTLLSLTLNRPTLYIYELTAQAQTSSTTFGNLDCLFNAFYMLLRVNILEEV
jgi:hypothetical protein